MMNLLNPARIFVVVCLILLAAFVNSANAASGLTPSTAKLEDYNEKLQAELKTAMLAITSGEYTYSSEMTKPLALADFSPVMQDQLYRMIADAAPTAEVTTAEVSKVVVVNETADLTSWYLTSGTIERRSKKLFFAVYMNSGLYEGKPVAFVSYYVFNEDGTGLTLGYLPNRFGAEAEVAAPVPGMVSL